MPLDTLLEKWGTIVHDEQIKTYEQPNIRKVHTPWRYFFRPDRSLMPKSTTPDEDIITHLVMKVNAERNGALIFSSGKNLGVFKAAGWPEDVANFYRIEDYKGYLWLAHNRYPTNTSGWWGGAHPFNLLNWSVVHNGEITSYGTNRRYIESYGYKCTMYTDTEVVAYLVDLLVQKARPFREDGRTGTCPPVLGRDRPDAAKGTGTQPGHPAHLWFCTDERSVCDLCCQRKFPRRIHRPDQTPSARLRRTRRSALHLQRRSCHTED